MIILNVYLQKIQLNGQTYITGVVYRPPNSNIVDFNNTVHSILEKVTQYPRYIMGGGGGGGGSILTALNMTSIPHRKISWYYVC